MEPKALQKQCEQRAQNFRDGRFLMDTPVGEWIKMIFEGRQNEVFFDEVYSYSFRSIGEGTYDQVYADVKNTFRICIQEKQDYLVTQEDLDFTDAFKEVCTDVGILIKQIQDLFYPLKIAKPDLNIYDDLMNDFREIIFLTPPTSEYVNTFLVSFAHNIVYKTNFEDSIPTINTFTAVINGTDMWRSFSQHIYDASDAFFTEACFTLLSNEDVRSNSLVYIGCAKEIINHMKKLWVLFPEDLANVLEKLAYDALITQVTDILFSMENQEILSTVLLEDFSNFPLLVDLINTIFTSDESRYQIILMMSQKYMGMAMAAAEKVRGKSMSVTVARDIINDIVPIFERIRIIGETALGTHKKFKTEMETVRRSILMIEDLKFEQAAAREISRSIEAIFNEPKKQRDEMLHIEAIGRVINYSSNRLDFMTVHNALMFVRLAACGGRQYRLEETVFSKIDSYLPPDLTDTFENLKAELKKSDTLNEAWRRENPESVLAVFVVDKKSQAGITSQIPLELPPDLKRMQDDFVAFYKKREAHRKLEWVYEDNQVQMRLNGDGYSIELTTPLFFAAVVIFLAQHPGATVAEICAGTKLGVADVRHLLGKGMTERFAMWKCRDKALGEDARIEWNHAFKPKTKRMTVVISPRFSTQVARDGITDKALAARRRARYSVEITRLLREQGAVSRSVASELIAGLISSAFVFNEDEFAAAIDGLTKRGIIRNNARDHRLIELVPSTK